MNPLLLLKIGPFLLRTVGKLFGGDVESVTDKVANVVDSVRGLPHAAAEGKLSEALGQLTPEELVALKQVEVQLAEIERDREANRLNADTAQIVSANQTIQTELEQGDDYVKHTRPLMGRISGYSGVGYILIAETAKLFGVGGGADPAVAATLLGPLGFYMTMRSVDAFSPLGKSK